MRAFSGDKEKEVKLQTRFPRDYNIDWAEARIHLAILRYELLRKRCPLRMEQEVEIPHPTKPRPSP